MQVIGVDPHKGSFTAAVVTAAGEPVEELRVVVGGRQLEPGAVRLVRAQD